MSTQKRRFALWATLALLVGALAFLAAGCGGDDDEGSSATQIEGLGSDLDEIQEQAQEEGQVNLVQWAGYNALAKEFTAATGCKVNTKDGASSDDMIDQIATGAYDGVSASGNASVRLMEKGDAAPINPDLIPNYADVFEGLKDQPHNSVEGASYGVPHGRGANLLMYRTDVVTPAPTSWSVVFDPNSPHKGKVTAYDSPIYIADAAVYLMTHKPELNIKNPYALDDTQFQAAIDLLKQQNTVIGEYWSDYTKEIQAFKSGDSVVGTTWQVITNLAQADKAPVEAILPAEGSTGWSDTWMISSKAKHPNCAYLWMNHIISPEANAAVAEWFGEAPSNKLSCTKTADKNHCTTFHAEDETYFSKVWYWTTPIEQCLDGRTDVKCKDYSAWTQAWTTIKG